MKLWRALRCWMNTHSPTPHRVGWDGGRYRGLCRYCGAAIVRLDHGKWRNLGEVLPGNRGRGFASAFEPAAEPRRRAAEREPDPPNPAHAHVRPRKIHFEFRNEELPWKYSEDQSADGSGDIRS